MSGTLLVRGARQLLTLRGPAEPRRGTALQELEIIRDGALVIKDGRIVEVGLTRRLESLTSIRPTEEIDATGRIVMPGFVDCHAHLIWGLPSAARDSVPRSGEDAPYAPAPTIQSICNSSARRLESRARQLTNAMVRHGTTTVGASSGYGLDARNELKVLKAHDRLDHSPLDVASTFLAPGSTANEHAGSRAAYLAWICSELLPAIRRRTFTRFVGLRCGEQGFQLDESRQYLEAARALGFELKIHATAHHSDEAVRLAVESGAISLDHLQHAGVAELDFLARSQTVAVLLPGADLQQFAPGSSPARQLIDAGAAVALGSNFNPGICSTYSMPAIVALACAHLNMSPAEAISAATFNAACAVGSARQTGSFEIGKSADLIVLNASDYREIPFHFGVNLVNRTLKRGLTIYQEGPVAAY